MHEAKYKLHHYNHITDNYRVEGGYYIANQTSTISRKGCLPFQCFKTAKVVVICSAMVLYFDYVIWHVIHIISLVYRNGEGGYPQHLTTC